MSDTTPSNATPASIAVIGGGPAGLMAAEILAGKGYAVTVYDQKPSVGRKFLMAGRGGLNLTHSEPLEQFLGRYGSATPALSGVIEAFPPEALRAWCEGLGQPTFTGSSGRIFPKSMKASPLLRAWLARLEQLGVTIKTQRRWIGWDKHGALVFLGAENQPETVTADATLLALGGASWPRLGSDGSWREILVQQKIDVTPLRPANCGFLVSWTDLFREKFAGTPVKPLSLSFGGQSVRGEMMITANGVEGGGIYALSAPLRDAIAADDTATLTLDLRPGLSLPDLEKRLSVPRGRDSFSNFLRKHGGLPPVAIGLLRESNPALDPKTLSTPALAALVKALPLTLTAPAPIDRAISTAGGIAFTALDPHFMLKKMPGVFAAGEMLDWEAPTGGYLLQGCFSTGVAAANGMDRWIARQKKA